MWWKKKIKEISFFAIYIRRQRRQQEDNEGDGVHVYKKKRMVLLWQFTENIKCPLQQWKALARVASGYAG